MILVCVAIVVILLVLGVRNPNVIRNVLKLLIAVGVVAAIAALFS